MTGSLARLRWLRGVAVVVAVLACGRPAQAAEPEPLRVALVIGVNQSVDAEAPPLHYADDDAARYFDLLDGLGIAVEILTRPDENTRRLHDHAATTAQVPRHRELEASVSRLAARVAAARRQGRRSVLYVFYAGHGNVDHGTGYVTLEDARLTGQELETNVLGAVHADRTHLVVDACHSYFLAYSRGPGGERRALGDAPGFLSLGQRPELGLLLSTSSARQSHEWERVQGGVFSHEVRSGLYGAADANGDGLIGYREMAAFVARANESVPNQRFRPDVFARPPAGDDVLLDLRSALARRIEIDAANAGRYELENADGVYLAAFHSEPGERVQLVRPSPGRLYLERVGDRKEFVIDGNQAVVRTSELELLAPHSQPRGADLEAFNRLFELPFGSDTVERFRYSAPPTADALSTDNRTSWRRYAGFGLLGVGAAAATVGTVGLTSALAASQQDGPERSQSQIAEQNRQIHRGNLIFGVGMGIGALAATAGVVLLLWPDGPATFDVGATPDAFGAKLRGRF